MWSASNVNSTEEALPRLNEWRCRMVSRGIPAEPKIVNPNGPWGDDKKWGEDRKYGFCPEPYEGP